eukprot:scaffold124137_cov33-Tisochrysis_lutea.AAC.3
MPVFCEWRAILPRPWRQPPEVTSRFTNVSIEVCPPPLARSFHRCHLMLGPLLTTFLPPPSGASSAYLLDQYARKPAEDDVGFELEDTTESPSATRHAHCAHHCPRGALALCATVLLLKHDAYVHELLPPAHGGRPVAKMSARVRDHSLH